MAALQLLMGRAPSHLHHQAAHSARSPPLQQSLGDGGVGTGLVSRCLVCITMLKLLFNVWALAVSQSLRSLLVEDKDGLVREVWQEYSSSVLGCSPGGL